MATEKLEIVIEADDRTSGALNTLQSMMDVATNIRIVKEAK